MHHYMPRRDSAALVDPRRAYISYSFGHLDFSEIIMISRSSDESWLCLRVRSEVSLEVQVCAVSDKNQSGISVCYCIMKPRLGICQPDTYFR